jgi:probable rRNA maturation factor
MINIEIIPEFRDLVSPDILELAAKTALCQQSAPEADLTLVLTGDTQIQKLDRDFMGIDSPTDVLSFPASETDPETGRCYLGDIIISITRAKAQAAAAGHSLEAELSLLVIHGILHILGYDHARKEEKIRMWNVQAKILKELNISPAIVHE